MNKTNLLVKRTFQLAALLFFVFSFPNFAFATPKLVIDSPVFDFKEIQEGVAIEHDYPIRNLGNSVLEVRKILPSCGCTAAVVSSDKLKPGESTSLKVRFETIGFRGYKVKTVRLYTNDPNNSSVVFTLKGKVRPAVEATPPQVNFGTVKKGTKETKEVLIQSDKRNKVSVIAVRPRSQFIKVEKVKTKGATRLRVSLDKKAPVGIFRSRIAVRTNSNHAPLINIPVFAKIKGDLSLSSAAVSFGLIQGPISKPKTATVELVNQSQKPVLLLSANSDHPNISVEFSAIEQGKKYRIKVALSGNISGALRAKIKLITDHEDPEQKEVILPVYGIVSNSND